MQALQADIARRVNKRKHTDPVSDHSPDTSIHQHFRPQKRSRHSSRPVAPPSRITTDLGPNVRITAPSSGLPFTIIVHDNGRTYSSHAPQRVPITEDEAGEEDGSSSAESQSLTETGTTGSEEDEEDDSDDDDDSEDSTSASDDSSLSTISYTSGSEENFRILPRQPPIRVNSSQHHRSTPTQPTIISKPAIRPGPEWQRYGQTGPRLKSRLNALLPRMRKANEELEVERREGRLGERDIEKLGQGAAAGYVEMELGLGVLEEKKGKGKTNRGAEADDAGENDVERALPALLPAVKRRGKVGIEVVRDGP